MKMLRTLCFTHTLGCIKITVMQECADQAMKMCGLSRKLCPLAVPDYKVLKLDKCAKSMV